MDEKIKISAPKSVYDLLKKDCEDFKITKPDGSPNMNAFLNAVVSDFYEEFAGAEEKLRDEVRKAVEIVPEAVRDAEKLMKKLGLADRVTEVCADAAEYMRSLPADGAPRALVLDPPRKGCDESVLAAAAEAAYSRIVYISCNPATLARDLKFLLPRGYTITSLRPYDMFPQTMHVETLVCLDKE